MCRSPLSMIFLCLMGRPITHIQTQSCQVTRAPTSCRWAVTQQCYTGLSYGSPQFLLIPRMASDYLPTREKRRLGTHLWNQSALGNKHCMESPNPQHGKSSSRNCSKQASKPMTWFIQPPNIYRETNAKSKISARCQKEHTCGPYINLTKGRKK